MVEQREESGPDRAWAEIDLGALRHNIGVLRRAAPDSLLMAVVKADAYGHGLAECAAAARDGGADWLGVALVGEALTLRAAGDTGPLLCWLSVPGDRFDECLRHDVDVSAYDTRMLAEIVDAAARTGIKAMVHLKVDTGLSRGGAVPPWDEFFAAARAAEEAGRVQVVGLWSHLAYADEPEHPTVARQLAEFERAIEVADAAGLQPRLRHLANSAATLRLPQTHFDLVRPGIAVYGISPGASVGTEAELDLRPVMTLKARLTMVKPLPAGAGVSYAHQYVTSRSTTAGLIPVGYADGIPRAASNVGPVLAAGAVRPIAGRVCMDQVVVDLDGDEAHAGDEVVFFGDGAAGHPTATEWAQATDTIAYEIVTRVGPRIPRIVVDSDEEV
ncbi:MAG: alanine racemase [Actinomycetota bacterium]|nr:alanine racemase [Actinomycetota bacterium]